MIFTYSQDRKRDKVHVICVTLCFSVDSLQQTDSSYCEISVRLEYVQYPEVQYHSAFVVNEKHACNECFQFLKAANWFSCIQAAS